VSHSSHDHAFAVSVAEALGSLSSDVECFVSGVSIQAGADWNREIREALGRSHLLLLLFTSPSQDWDWCLYEAGLYTRFHEEQVSSVVSLFRPAGSGPRPLSNLQGVPASSEKVERFLNTLCHETWKASDDWLKGPLAPDASPDLISAAADRIVTAFPGMRSGDEVYHPCHRVVLDLTRASNDGFGIPLDARVVEGDGATSTYTLSLFRAASGTRSRTWGGLVAAVGGENAAWRHQLDRRFEAALRGELFTPTTATLRAFDPEQRQRRYYRPVLYELVRGVPDVDATTGSPAKGAVVIFDPQLAPDQVGGPAFNLVRINARFATEVFDSFCGTIAARQRTNPAVFDEISEAFGLIYEEADRFGLFDVGEIERAYGGAYESSGVGALIDEWERARQRLDHALTGRDPAATEALLSEMHDLNRQFSLAATKRYLESLQPTTSAHGR
jgi:hypothetical protein